MQTRKIEIPEKCRDCFFREAHNWYGYYCTIYEEPVSPNTNLDLVKPSFCRAISVTIEEKETIQDVTLEEGTL